MRTQLDRGMLGAALIGYQSRLEQVKEKINEIQGLLGGHKVTVAAQPAHAPKHHRISAAGRARIAAAQRKRWAAAKKAKAA